MAILAINELSDKYKVRPLREGQTKVYKLIRTGKVRPYIQEKDTRQPIAPPDPGASFPGQFVMYDDAWIDDKGQKAPREVLIMAVSDETEERIIGGIIHVVPKSKRINFDKGYLRLDYENQSELIWAERSNLNVSNMKRKKSNLNVFMEVRQNTEEITAHTRYILKSKAYNIVSELKDYKQAQAYLKAVGIEYPAKNAELKTIFTDLMKKIDESYENVKSIINAYSGSDAAKTKASVVIDDAIFYKVILQDTSASMFVLNETNEEILDKEGNSIKTIEGLEDKYLTDPEFKKTIHIYLSAAMREDK